MCVCSVVTICSPYSLISTIIHPLLCDAVVVPVSESVFPDTSRTVAGLMELTKCVFYNKWIYCDTGLIYIKTQSG